VVQLDIVADAAADEVDDVIEIAGDLVAGDRLRGVYRSASRRRLLGPSVLVEGDEAQDLDMIGELAEIDIRPVALDDLLLLELPVPVMAGLGESPALVARSRVLIRPSACRAARIFKSVRSTFCAFAMPCCLRFRAFASALPGPRQMAYTACRPQSPALQPNRHWIAQ